MYQYTNTNAGGNRVQMPPCDGWWLAKMHTDTRPRNNANCQIHLKMSQYCAIQKNKSCQNQRWGLCADHQAGKEVETICTDDDGYHKNAVDDENNDDDHAGNKVVTTYKL